MLFAPRLPQRLTAFGIAVFSESSTHDVSLLFCQVGAATPSILKEELPSYIEI